MIAQARQAARIIVFAKAPQAGFAKTRLIPALGAEGAAKLAHRMLLQTLCSAMDAAIGAIELCVTPAITASAWSCVNIPQGVEVTEQGEGDLGARLARAAERAIGLGEPVLLIGTDCAEMSATLLRAAAATLARKDAVIYPAADGGYVLLGLTKFHPTLFGGMAWSTDSVARDTMERIGRLGWSLERGPCLYDIDGPDDLERAPPGWL